MFFFSLKLVLSVKLWWLTVFLMSFEKSPISQLTHHGPVTQYCGGSILCKNPIFFIMKEFPQIFWCCNFLKVDIIIFKNPLQKLRIFTFWLFLGGSLCRKNAKKSFFERLWGENGHNSINIKPRALKLLAFDRELNFSSNQAKTRHWVAKKIEQSSIFLATLVKIPPFFNFFA